MRKDKEGDEKGKRGRDEGEGGRGKGWCPDEGKRGEGEERDRTRGARERGSISP